mmetsp:Transcript_24654/g.48362  ORF Transcript_24654/g.48362 Transcript_24654/m.48362 type:complete len:234 (-) Transcript_24654:789-1490(-)
MHRVSEERGDLTTHRIMRKRIQTLGRQVRHANGKCMLSLIQRNRCTHPDQSRRKDPNGIITHVSTRRGRVSVRLRYIYFFRSAHRLPFFKSNRKNISIPFYLPDLPLCANRQISLEFQSIGMHVNISHASFFIHTNACTLCLYLLIYCCLAGPSPLLSSPLQQATQRKEMKACQSVCSCTTPSKQRLSPSSVSIHPSTRLIEQMVPLSLPLSCFVCVMQACQPASQPGVVERA